MDTEVSNTIEKAELDKMIKLHREWLTPGHRGKILRLDRQTARYARFSEADLSNAAFSGCDLQNAKFTGCTFHNAGFHNCDLQKADFSGAILDGVNFADCALEYADFGGATVRNCAFYGTTVAGIYTGSAVFKNLSGIAYATFSAGPHDAIFVGGYGQIGCERHAYNTWLHDGRQIGRDHNYPADRITVYMGMIRVAVKFLARLEAKNGGQDQNR